jgi:hypothetical protein
MMLVVGALWSLWAAGPSKSPRSQRSTAVHKSTGLRTGPGCESAPDFDNYLQQHLPFDLVVEDNVFAPLIVAVSMV